MVAVGRSLENVGRANLGGLLAVLRWGQGARVLPYLWLLCLVLDHIIIYVHVQRHRNLIIENSILLALVAMAPKILPMVTLC